MRRISLLLLPLLGLFATTAVSVSAALIPSSPQEQTRRAIRSIRDAIQQQQGSDSRTSGNGQARGGAGCRRLYVDYLIPLPVETKAEDIDPWPGGLAQMYPYAENVVQEILAGVVGDEAAAGPCSSVVISPADCCGFLVQESKTSAKNDVAAILFPGVDQLDKMDEIDRMVGPDRTLILFNRQFQRLADFGFSSNVQNRAKSLILDRYTWGFAFQEMACRGEDLKLTFEYPTWKSCVICDEDAELGTREIALLDPQPERPAYDALEKKINEVLPEPLWMRKMGEAERKGFKFQRSGRGQQ
jgi:Domain of unknown function (DUF1995)